MPLFITNHTTGREIKHPKSSAIDKIDENILPPIDLNSSYIQNKHFKIIISYSVETDTASKNYWWILLQNKLEYSIPEKFIIEPFRWSYKSIFILLILPSLIPV
jgi:hypothetical protein